MKVAPYGPEPIRVFVVAPTMVRWGLGRLLTSENGFALAGESECLESAFAHMARARFDVLLLETESAQQRRVLQSCNTLLRDFRVLALSSGDHTSLDWALMCGLRGIADQRGPVLLLQRAIRKVHEGELWIDRAAMTRILARVAQTTRPPVSEGDLARIARLTLREKQTVHALATNVSLPCKVVADRLCISEHTLRNHMTSIYAKLQLRSRADLYAFTARNGLAAEDAAGATQSRSTRASRLPSAPSISAG